MAKLAASRQKHLPSEGVHIMQRVTLIAFLLLGAMLIFPQESLGQPQKGPLTSEEAIKKAQEVAARQLAQMSGGLGGLLGG